MISMSLESMKRICEVLDEESLIVNGENPVYEIRDGSVEFKNVRFGYLSYTPVLKEINFKVKQGETIGIVGHSGSGKSTLVNLLMKLYDCDYGQILIDGKDIKEIELSNIHKETYGKRIR